LHYLIALLEPQVKALPIHLGHALMESVRDEVIENAVVLEKELINELKEMCKLTAQYGERRNQCEQLKVMVGTRVLVIALKVMVGTLVLAIVCHQCCL
jgi:hypothetical protein